MKKEDLVRKIRDDHQKHGKTLKTIHDELKKSGYKSPRNNKPISYAYVRYLYNYGFKGAGEYGAHVSSAGVGADSPENIKKKVDQVLSMKSVSAEDKITMITILLKS
jgi:hypothetical protein